MEIAITLVVIFKKKNIKNNKNLLNKREDSWGDKNIVMLGNKLLQQGIPPTKN